MGLTDRFSMNVDSPRNISRLYFSYLDKSFNLLPLWRCIQLEKRKDSGRDSTKDCIVFEINTEIIDMKPGLVHRRTSKKIQAWQLRKITPNRSNRTNSPASIAHCEFLAVSPLSPYKTSHAPQESNEIENDEAQMESGNMNLHRQSFERSLTTKRLSNGTSSITASPDIWSAAFREAVESLGEEIDFIALRGKNIIQLFRDLEDIGKKETHDSAFLRGVKYLQSLQVPLETFKLALDLASPLSSLEPTAATVVGVVRSVTAVIPAMEPIIPRP